MLVLKLEELELVEIERFSVLGGLERLVLVLASELVLAGPSEL